MTLRHKAIEILEIIGEPIEPNEHCEYLIRAIIKIIDKRRLR